MAKINYRKTAKTNPKVDSEKMDQLLRGREEMEKAGVFVQSGYNISPRIGPPRNRKAETITKKLHVRVF